VVDITMKATGDVNPDTAGSGAPLTVRIYQLGAAANFNGADFFQLFNQDEATLKSDLIKQEGYLLAPGQEKTVTITPNDQVKAIGFFAAYRMYAQSAWRASVDIPPHQTTTISVVAGRNGLQVMSKSATPAKPGA
jgi:type VI secretion system protein VasD